MRITGYCCDFRIPTDWRAFEDTQDGRLSNPIAHVAELLTNSLILMHRVRITILLLMCPIVYQDAKMLKVQNAQDILDSLRNYVEALYRSCIDEE